MALTAKKVYAILKRQISDMEAKLNSPVRYRGTVATADLLPLNPDIGDMYNIESKSIYGEAGMNVAWNGVVWDTMGAPIDMSLYLTKEEAEAVIQRLVTEYFEKNPVKPGATTEQAQQIEQNKTDIASLKVETGSLKEDISTKITKFYASSQGETHIADSDNGKITDMVLYGRSEQKQYSGKNLLNPTLQTTIKNGVTCTANGDGTYTLNGTTTTTTVFDIAQDVSYSSFRLAGCPVGGAHDASYELQARTDNLIYGYDTGDGKNIKANENFFIRIRINTGINCNNLLFKPMIVDASLYPDATYDDFEPYTGGIPSPNPDYPQEIKSVVNPIVKVCGKNLSREEIYKININNSRPCLVNKKVTSPVSVAAWAGIGFAIKVAPNTQYTISTDASNNDYLLVGEYKSVNDVTNYNNCIKHIERSASGNITFTSSPECNTIVCCIMPKEACNISWTYWQIELGSTPTAYEPYHEQTVTLPYTLNAIPVSSGGNVTIDGQQYIADYVDVERGKLVRRADSSKLDNTQSIVNKTEWLLAEPQEIDLTQEEVQALKTLVTYYPTTNISINSDQLDGYTVFNYPISMENGWNYVKQQIGDTRDYIYDMDARTQDTDLQAAEAYVNSEYAVALTELEV